MELRSLYHSPNMASVIKSRRLRWEGIYECFEGRCKDNIRMDLKEIGVNMNRVDSAEDTGYWKALLNAALNLRVS